MSIPTAEALVIMIYGSYYEVLCQNDIHIVIGKERMQQEIWFQKYRILGLLGYGGTAKVYLAEHILLKSYRAIKCISKNHPLYDILRNEALILKNLKHSCVPIIYDIEENEEGSYIVEQYLEGETLQDYVLTKGPLGEADILKFGTQLCDLIQYLHTIDRPILYLDLKPENIIVMSDGLKLIDFGSAVYLDQLKEDNRYTGTKGYAAPELYSHNMIDERCDVYGIGMLLYYMVTGKNIKADSGGIDNIDLACDCSKGLKRIINQSLKYNPASRYATVSHLYKHLRTLQSNTRLQSESSQLTVIAVAGSQDRIGVTHFSFRLCSFLRKQGLKCLYTEQKGSNTVRAIKNSYEGIKVSKGVLRARRIDMFIDEPSTRIEQLKPQVIVKDMGCLREDRLEEFSQADYRYLILGAKEWERPYSEQVLGIVKEYKDIICLFNFLDGRQFQQVLKNMERRHCYRLPFEPDPFSRITGRNGLELFWELWDIGGLKDCIRRSAKQKTFKHSKSEG